MMISSKKETDPKVLLMSKDRKSHFKIWSQEYTFKSTC
jgi:hypothetical protein